MLLQEVREFRVLKDRWGACVDYDEIIAVGLPYDLIDIHVLRRGIDQAALGYHRRRIGKPGRIPERTDFAACLVSRPRSSVESSVRGWIKQ